MNFNKFLNELVIDNNFIEEESYFIKYKIDNTEYVEFLGEYFGSEEIEYMNSDTWYYNFENGSITNEYKLRELLNNSNDITDVEFFITGYYIHEILHLIYKQNSYSNCCDTWIYYRIIRDNNRLLIVNLNTTTTESDDDLSLLFSSDFPMLPLTSTSNKSLFIFLKSFKATI